MKSVSSSLCWGIVTSMLVVFGGGIAVSECSAQTFDESFELWPVDLKINGTIYADTSKDLKRAAELWKIATGRLDNASDGALIVTLPGVDLDASAWGQLTADPDETDDPTEARSNDEDKNVDPVDVISLTKKSINDVQSKIDLAARVFLITGGNETNLLVSLRASLASLIDRKGTVIMAGQGVYQLGTFDKKSSLGLIPDAQLVTQEHPTHGQAAKATRMVQLQLSDNARFLFRGRKLMLMEGSATVGLPATDRDAKISQKLKPRRTRRQDPNEYLVDWTQWRRLAIDRSVEPFPLAKPPIPCVDNGTLFIVGGGGMPRNLMRDFVTAAGGKEAKLVYVPCSEQESVSQRQGIVSMWKQMGVAEATFIHTKDRNLANENEAFLKPLQDATGVWFGGGRQWNFADSYYGTTAHRLMKEVLQRGGAIGGSSAGASIQARYLARATPIGNFDIMAPGYERGGLGFLGGVAIDQHFTQRRRQKDMTQLVDKYPQLLGIGIDEATAIIVKKSLAKVVGRGRVHFYDRNIPVVDGKPDFVALPQGSEYDLAKRKIIVDVTPEPQDSSSEKNDQSTRSD